MAILFFLFVSPFRRITSYNVCYTKLLRVPRDIDPSQELAGAEIEVTTYIAVENKEEPVKYTGKKDIWNAWCTRLGSLPPERSLNWTGWASWDQVTATTILDAAIQIVATDRAALGRNNFV